MTATIHRVLATISGIASGLGGLIAMPGFDILNIPAEAGAVLALIAGAVAIVSTQIRSNFPG